MCCLHDITKKNTKSSSSMRGTPLNIFQNYFTEFNELNALYHETYIRNFDYRRQSQTQGNNK